MNAGLRADHEQLNIEPELNEPTYGGTWRVRHFFIRKLWRYKYRRLS